MPIIGGLAVKALGVFAYMLLEKWLGNTRRVAANSVLDLIIQTVVSIIPKRETFIPRKEENMNVELKAMIAMVFDSINLVEQAAQKVNFFILLPQIFQVIAVDLPPVISNWGDLANEIKALPGTQQEQDLINFIQSKFPQIAGGGKAAAILSAVLKMIMDLAQDAVALEKAIKS